MDTGTHARITEGTAKVLARRGNYREAAEILKTSALRKDPPANFSYTFRWTRLKDFMPDVAKN